ncbi:hypothetical protein Bbelb_141380 [Branchiostoma belcheri]|nr:hypothetical protein Bbelb_141380 [Branchiostoma belcheri]
MRIATNRENKPRPPHKSQFGLQARPPVNPEVRGSLDARHSMYRFIVKSSSSFRQAQWTVDHSLTSRPKDCFRLRDNSQDSNSQPPSGPEASKDEPMCAADFPVGMTQVSYCTLLCEGLNTCSRHFATCTTSYVNSPVAHIRYPSALGGHNSTAMTLIRSERSTAGVQDRPERLPDELHRLWWDHVGIRPRYAGRGASASSKLPPGHRECFSMFTDRLSGQDSWVVRRGNIAVKETPRAPHPLPSPPQAASTKQKPRACHMVYIPTQGNFTQHDGRPY